MGIVFKNNAKTTLSSAVNNSTTTIPVTDGSVFPAADLAGAGTFFLLTLEEDGNSPAIEIVKVTTCSGASGNINLTVVRAQEGTSATAFDSGDKAELRFTSGTIDHIRSDNTVHTNIFTTANASTTAFTLNQAVTDENDLVVFIDGVFQAHNTYTVSGTTLTLATAPASGRVVTAYSIKGLRSATNVAIATMTGDNSDTTLTLPIEPINENSVQVFFDGVYQNKSTFSVSGTTLTFSTAPPTGVEVEAILLTQTNIDTAAILKDADGDTKIQVEESTDEDTIRMDIAGTEVLTLTNSAMTLKGTTPTLTIGDGGAEDTKIVFDGQEDYYIGLDDSADSLVIGHGSTVGTAPAISINTSEQVILESTLHLLGGVDRRIQLSTSGSGSSPNTGDNNCHVRGNDDVLILNCAGNGAIKFQENGSERMRITSSGKVGIGTTAPAAVLDVVSSGTTSTAFRVLKSGTSTQNLHAATEISGHGRYSIYDASENEDIRFDSNGDSYFNGGQFNVGQTGSTSATKVTFNAGAQHGQFIDNVGNSYAAITVKSDSNNNFFPLYMVTGTAGVKGYILTNSSGTQFNTSGSDERLKENIVDWNESVLDSFKSIKPKTFNFKDDENKTNVKGYIAQNEVDKFPEAYPINPRDDMHYFNPTGMTVYLMKAIQELSAKVEELEGKIE